MIEELSPETARDIVDALRDGTVPGAGLEHIAVGMDGPINAIKKELQQVATKRGTLELGIGLCVVLLPANHEPVRAAVVANLRVGVVESRPATRSPTPAVGMLEESVHAGGSGRW